MGKDGKDDMQMAQKQASTRSQTVVQTMQSVSEKMQKNGIEEESNQAIIWSQTN